jgi:hypothetical protein
MSKVIDSLEQLDWNNGFYNYADYLTWKFEQTVALITAKNFPSQPIKPTTKSSRYLQ